jgi:hypothetical protein
MGSDIAWWEESKKSTLVYNSRWHAMMMLCGVLQSIPRSLHQRAVVAAEGGRRKSALPYWSSSRLEMQVRASQRQ